MAAVATVRDERIPGELPIYRQPEWAARFPWLVQGTTARGEGDAFDLRLFGATPVGEVIDRWLRLRQALGVSRAAHARQVHGSDILLHGAGPPGLLVSERYDGHASTHPDLLLTVSVADCVPISLVAPHARAIAMLHGGWRGVAAGILERGVALVRHLSGADAAGLFLHLGPSICGRCYEVGPEVFHALGLPVPERPTPVDLRAALAERATRLGIPTGQISISGFCTRCGDGADAGSSPFFSHRGGCVERQLGFLAVRPGA